MIIISTDLEKYAQWVLLKTMVFFLFEAVYRISHFEDQTDMDTIRTMYFGSKSRFYFNIPRLSESANRLFTFLSIERRDNSTFDDLFEDPMFRYAESTILDLNNERERETSLMEPFISWIEETLSPSHSLDYDIEWTTDVKGEYRDHILKAFRVYFNKEFPYFGYLPLNVRLRNSITDYTEVAKGIGVDTSIIHLYLEAFFAKDPKDRLPRDYKTLGRVIKFCRTNDIDIELDFPLVLYKIMVCGLRDLRVSDLLDIDSSKISIYCEFFDIDTNR
jgi:hypothetical protein